MGFVYKSKDIPIKSMAILVHMYKTYPCTRYHIPLSNVHPYLSVCIHNSQHIHNSHHISCHIHSIFNPNKYCNQPMIPAIFMSFHSHIPLHIHPNVITYYTPCSYHIIYYIHTILYTIFIPHYILYSYHNTYHIHFIIIRMTPYLFYIHSIFMP